MSIKYCIIQARKDSNGNQDEEGANPFYSIFTEDGHRLSNYVTLFKSQYSTSKYVYDDIEEHIEDLIEDAINNRFKY